MGKIPRGTEIFRGIFYDKKSCHYVLTRKVVNARMRVTNKVVIIKEEERVLWHCLTD